MSKMNAAVAALKVFESWGIKRVYGLPAGSFHAWMYAFEKEKDKIDFIQVRHEEVGSLAAVMQTKFGGGIGVAMGSGGPGFTHLANGIYEAREDHQPMLVIAGSATLEDQNMDAFQEMNQNPIYSEVAVYNRKIAYPEQIPHVFDEAIRQALAKRGPAVVEMPQDMGMEDIPEEGWWSSAKSHQDYQKLVLDKEKIKKAAEFLSQAKKPLIFAGVGTRGSGKDVIALSKKIKAPLNITGINYDNFDHRYEGLMGAMGRVSDKPANDIVYEADVILYAGSNWPFAHGAKPFQYADHVIQIDINPEMLGKRGDVDLAILGDAGDNIRAITELVEEKEESSWWKIALEDRKNWDEYKEMLETRKEGPLRLYQVYDAINRFSEEDAIYSIDVGDTTQTSVRHLKLTPKNMWRTSPLFATMGVGLPGAIAAKLEYPERQVWSLAGDGGWSMVYPDLVTAVQNKLGTINVVFANRQFGFIKDKYEDTIETAYGTEFVDVDFAAIARAQGAEGYTVKEIHELDEVFTKAVADAKLGKTVVIDAKILSERPVPTEFWMGGEARDKEGFDERYETDKLVKIGDLLEREGIESNLKD